MSAALYRSSSPNASRRGGTLVGVGFSPGGGVGGHDGTPVGITAVKKGSRTMRAVAGKIANKMEAATGVNLHQVSQFSLVFPPRIYPRIGVTPEVDVMF